MVDARAKHLFKSTSKEAKEKMYGGGSKCHICGKSAFPFDSQSYSGRWYHDTCFKCKFCNNRIPSVSEVSEYETQIYHKVPPSLFLNSVLGFDELDQTVQVCFLKNFKESGGKYAGRAVGAAPPPSSPLAPPPPKPRSMSLQSSPPPPPPRGLQMPSVVPLFNEYTPFADKRGGLLFCGKNSRLRRESSGECV